MSRVGGLNEFARAVSAFKQRLENENENCKQTETARFPKYNICSVYSLSIYLSICLYIYNLCLALHRHFKAKVYAIIWYMDIAGFPRNTHLATYFTVVRDFKG